MATVTLDGESFLIATSGPESTRLGWLLRRALRKSVTRSSTGCYRVNRDAALTLLRLLGDAEWSSDALELAHQKRGHQDLQMHAKVEVADALEDPRRALAGYPLLHKLDPHQVEAVAAATVPSLRGLALWDEQGTGKTVMALCAFDRLRQMEHVERLLVLAPKSVLGSWERDARLILDDRYRVSIVDGDAAKRLRQWQAPHDILLCSYDTAAADRGKVEMLVSQRSGRYMLVLDESYYVKNPVTRRSQVVTAIRPYCERALTLCGTPAPNTARDLANQITLADGGAALEGRTLPDDDDQARSIVEQALQDTIYLRRLKHEVLPDIPAKRFDVLHMSLCPVQAQLYAQAAHDLADAVRRVGEREFRLQFSSFMARRAALLQLCSHPGALDPAYDEKPAKMDALDRLIADLVERGGEKVVIWSYYRFSLDQIARRYAHYGLVRIDGSVAKLEDRVHAIRRFQEDPSVSIFMGNAAAAGAGITLTAARHAIYESFSNQAAHWLQSIDRIHRRGQDREVTCHVLIAEGTIEEREFTRLQEKERASRELLGDVYEEPLTRERFIEDLGVISST